jgi:hypothetical protein
MYYPDKDNLDATPEVKCAYLDVGKDDYKNKFNGCQRLYFMSMSKAMAAECSGDVFVMTTANLKENEDVPEDGIWWQVEFPTLIDPNRAEDKKITKVSTCHRLIWKLERHWVLINLLDYIHPGARSYRCSIESIERVTRER